MEDVVLPWASCLGQDSVFSLTDAYEAEAPWRTVTM